MCFWQKSVHVRQMLWKWNHLQWHRRKEHSGCDQYLCERQLEIVYFHWTISKDWAVALGNFSYFLALITFSTTQPRCTGILLVLEAASTTEQASSRPTTSHVQGSSSLFHLCVWPGLFSVFLPTAFQVVLFPPICFTHLGWQLRALTIFSMR